MKISHSSRKRFGQHFLHDGQIIQRIIATIAPKSEQYLVEIGPGKGALTIPLLEFGCQLAVIELDRDLIEWLKQKMASCKQLHIHNADALKFDFEQLVTNEQPLRIIGNLPYNISTAILFHLLKYVSHIQDMTFMLQKEVVDRMVAVPNTSDYGRLSVMLQYHCQIDKLFDVNQSAFFPKPKVMSSFVQLIPHSAPPVKVINQTHFSQVVAHAFSQRRKTLRNTLKKLFETKEIQTVGIDPQVSAETLTLFEFAQLSNEFTLKQSKI